MSLDSDEKDYSKKDYSKCCDYCLSELPGGAYHCGNRPTFLGCHEFFFTAVLLREHRHPKTGGCRNPENIEDYFRLEGVWHKKESKPEEESTQDPSRNSRRTRGVEKRSTSNDSDERTYRADQRPGRS